MQEQGQFVIVDLDDTLLYTSEYNTMLYCDAVEACTGLRLGALSFGGSFRLTSQTIKAVFEGCFMQREEEVLQRVRDIIALKRTMASSPEGKSREGLIKPNERLWRILEEYRVADVIILTNADEARAKYLFRLFALERIASAIYSNPNPMANKYSYIKGLIDLNPRSCIVYENEQTQIELALSVGFERERIVHIS